MEFKLHSEYKPTGDQPQAIEALVKGFKEGNQFETLLGVTGSGKTFTMANVIQQLQKPTLIISHNKTLAGQLYGEMKEFFPENAVEYFVSYYDYYQPEAYVPQTDTYIAKDSAINDEIDKLRLSATASLAERNDVIVVASVSCIYGLGSPEEFKGMSISLRPGMSKDRDETIKELIAIQYTRNDLELGRCNFRVRGDTIEIFPANADDYLIRVEFFGDEIDRITEVEPVTAKVKNELSHVMIYPASHYVVPQEKINKACDNIEKELEEQVRYFKGEDRLIEAHAVDRIVQKLESMQPGEDDIEQSVTFIQHMMDYGETLAHRQLEKLGLKLEELARIPHAKICQKPQLQTPQAVQRRERAVLVDMNPVLDVFSDMEKDYDSSFRSLMKKKEFTPETKGILKYILQRYLRFVHTNVTTDDSYNLEDFDEAERDDVDGFDNL